MSPSRKRILVYLEPMERVWWLEISFCLLRWRKLTAVAQ